MSFHQGPSRKIILVAIIHFFALRLGSNAATILTGPFFNQAAKAPLAGLLELTTDTETRVSISVDDGDRVWQRNFPEYKTKHAIPLLGFRPKHTNLITVTVHDRNRQSKTIEEPLVFVTAPLPADFPQMKVLASDPSRMEPGYTLFRVALATNTKSYLVAVDSAGEVVWYSGNINTTLDVRQLENGNLFLPLTSSFTEVTMLGDTVNTWKVPDNLNINFHDGVMTGHGTILYLNDASRTVSNFPTSTTDSSAPLRTTNVLFNRVVEMSTENRSLLNLWSPLDVLDPLRLTYLSLIGGGALGVDIEHSNAVIEDPSDDSIIVSMRHQNAIIKFSRATGELKWILGPHENWGPEFQRYLLTPVGEPFEWQYGQHAPMITLQGTLLVYDDGNYRATPFNPPLPDSQNYSRAVEYKIDEERMEVSQVWEYGSNLEEPLYTDKVGNADSLPKTGNVLIDFGSITYVNGTPPSPFGTRGTMVRIKEVTHDPEPEVVFDLALSEFDNPSTTYSDCFVYRCRRIPDLYGHLAGPVTDLAISFNDDLPRLEFSGDETRTYVIEVSSDLEHWTEAGIATPGEQGGEFDFDDEGADGASTRFYRIITQ